jgi:hypothetical protein
MMRQSPRKHLFLDDFVNPNVTAICRRNLPSTSGWNLTRHETSQRGIPGNGPSIFRGEY